VIPLDVTDRKIIDRIQHRFPIVSRPFDHLGNELGISADEVVHRISRLQEAGVIRKIGAVFDIQRTGHVSTLCAAHVLPDRLENVITFINAFDEVTHNYLRNHHYNVWFTVIAPTKARLETVLTSVAEQHGVVELLDLRAEKVFKIRVDFRTATNNTPGDPS